MRQSLNNSEVKECEESGLEVDFSNAEQTLNYAWTNMNDDIVQLYKEDDVYFVTSSGDFNERTFGKFDLALSFLLELL